MSGPPGRAIRAALLLAIAACLALAAGCSGEPPVISRVFSRVTCLRDPQSARISEALSVFLVASDPDGIEDLSAFYVIGDDAELFWKVESGSWVKSTAEGETWIGTNSLALPGSLPLPSGEYRVLLQDAAGETVEQTFTIPSDRPSPAEQAYPRADVKDGAIVVTGPHKDTEVRVYGNDGRYRMSFAAGKPTEPLELSRIAAAVPGLGEDFTFRVAAFDEKSGCGVESGPYPSRSLPLK
jgi:hypothetical protein